METDFREFKTLSIYSIVYAGWYNEKKGIKIASSSSVGKNYVRGQWEIARFLAI